METRKGTIFDIGFIAVSMFAVFIGIVIAFLVFGKINTELSASGFTPTQLQPLADSQSATSNFNVLGLLIFIGMGISAVISAFAVRTHPIFFIIFFIVQVVMVTITPMIQTAFTSITTSSADMNTTMLSFPYFVQIMNNLPMITLILSSLVALAMFALPGQ
jgi:hypothetical protein